MYVLALKDLGYGSGWSHNSGQHTSLYARCNFLIILKVLPWNLRKCVINLKIFVAFLLKKNDVPQILLSLITFL